MTNAINSVAGVDDFATMVKDLMAERDKLQADLAAARALLLEARMRIWHTCGSEGESKCLSHRVDAALAEGKK